MGEPNLVSLIQGKEIFFAARTSPLPAKLIVEADRALLSPRAQPKRVDDFLSARWCAREALKQMGFHHGFVPRGKEGEPIWPAGVVGSLTHTEGLSLAMVASQGSFASLGIDAEHLGGTIDDHMIQSVCHPSELSWMTSEHGVSKQVAAKLLFSIRESLYKAIFPLVRWKPDYHDVAISILSKECEFKIQFENDRHNLRSIASTLNGRYLITPTHIISLVLI